MQYRAEVRELAFQEWYACGMIDDKTASLMADKHDYAINPKTIADWRNKYSWADRAAKMDLMKQAATDAAATSDEAVLASAYQQKARYDKIFEYYDNAIGADPKELNAYTQAMHAYTPLLAFIVKMEEKIGTKRGDKKSSADAGLGDERAAELREQILGIK